MKIVLCYDDRVRHDSTGVYFMEAFQRIADVVKCYPEELPHISRNGIDLYVKIDDGLFKEKFPDDMHPSAFYAIDTHIESVGRSAWVREGKFDYVFCAQQRGTSLDWGTKNVYFLPLACDTNFHVIKGTRHKMYDICFIGNTSPGWHPIRVEKLDKLFSEIPNFYFGQQYFKKMAEKYAESKIVFNYSIGDDINMRVFEALASGSMLLTNKIPWFGLFEPDKHFIEYENDEDMLRKARYYIENAEERERIAKHGQMEVVSKHTYMHRCSDILKLCTQKS